MQAAEPMPRGRPRARSRRAVLSIRRNPFDPRDASTFEVDRALTLEQLATASGIDRTREPVLASIDGRPVLQRDWGTRNVEPGSLAVLQVLPRGGGSGGGSGGGKATLRTVLMIAVTVAAFAVAGPLAGAFGFTSALAVSATAAALSVAGSMLVNALIPPQPPALGDYGSGRAGISSSPTYTLQGRGNTARIGQPIPVVYGRHLVTPDFAATPYWEYEDNEQYLYQLFVIGQGSYDIEQIRIGESDIGAFPDVEYEIVGPGDDVALFDPNVYNAGEVSGQQLRAPDEDGNGAGDAGYDWTGFVTNITDHSTDAPVKWMGPFACCPSDTTATEIGIDIILPRGLYSTPETPPFTPVPFRTRCVVEVLPVDGNGIQIGESTVFPEIVLSGLYTSPQRVSYRFTLPVEGRYMVRVARTFYQSTDKFKNVHEASWGGLRGYLTGPTSFGDLTLIAVKARATDSLNSQTARQFSAVVTRKLPVWDGTAWSAPVATRSIAWAAADVLRNTDYGGGLADARIDLDQLLALDAVWAARGDTFDAVFDQPSTVWDALGKVLRAGRARPFHQSGLVRFYRDHEQTMPVALFSAGNIVKDSFSMDFVMPVSGETADGVEVEYFDARIWKPASVVVGVDGATPSNAAREQLFGVTSAEQATREAAYQAAANRFRRVFVSFDTELDGHIPSVGDAVLVAHDVPRWGLSGVVVGWTFDTLTLTLDRSVDLDSEVVNFVRVRGARGQASSEVEIVSQTSPTQIVLAEAPDVAFELGGTQEPTHWTIGTAADVPRMVIVAAITPRGDRISVRGVLDDDRVHVN